MTVDEPCPTLTAIIIGHAGNLAAIGYYLSIALQGGKVFP